MKTDFKNTPRQFQVGDITISDMGKVALDPDELISLQSAGGEECDIVAKSWGYYLGGSLNGRMLREGYKTALVMNAQGKLFVNAVRATQLEDFQGYLAREASRVVCWLDEWREAGS